MMLGFPASSFQLTPSRRATVSSVGTQNSKAISTHALTEGDYKRIHEYQHIADFNSRPHGGRRRELLHILIRYSDFNSRPHGGRRWPYSRWNAYFHFNSRPHGGRPFPLGAAISKTIISTHALTEGDDAFCGRGASVGISTHALTEGDCKFRQIFLLNRGYAYSISLYFLPHFISLLPQILSFQQKSFKFQVRIFLLFSVHLAFALQNQCVHHVKSRFCTNMFYFIFVLFTQIVKSQTISLFIYDFF